MYNNPDEKTLKTIMKNHGFIIAAELIELRGFSRKMIRTMIDSWNNYPKCMEIFPKTLSPKLWNDTTNEYTRIIQNRR